MNLNAGSVKKQTIIQLVNKQILKLILKKEFHKIKQKD